MSATDKVRETYRSEPARSTKESLPRVTFCVWRLVFSMMMEMMRWEREESLFIWVEEVCRLSRPALTAAISCEAEVTSTTVAPGTVTMPFTSFLISSLGYFACEEVKGVRASSSQKH